MIKFDDTYQCERDAYQWKLYVWHDGTNKDGEPTRNCKTFYYANLKSVLEAVADMSAGECESVKEWDEKIRSMMESIHDQ